MITFHCAITTAAATTHGSTSPGNYGYILVPTWNRINIFTLAWKIKVSRREFGRRTKGTLMLYGFNTEKT
jgi:hypothetical protein